MTLPLQPPRDYRLRDCYRGRVWRDPASMLARDALWVAIAAALAGLAYDERAFVLLGLAFAALCALVAALATLATNLRRVTLLRAAPAVSATLGRARRVFLLHELFRGKDERTFAVPYRFTDPAGRARRATLWICGCARDRLPEGAVEWVAVDPARPRRTLLLRAAVMTAAH
ncbi:MAG: hypothetical protein H6703_05210 [Myxococcales bacterium]|nr:hypothetical protein [Myxococcales bacterium]